MSNYTNPNDYNDSNDFKSPMVQNLEPISIQINPDKVGIDNLKAALRSKTSYVFCPYCRNQSLTKVNSQRNMIDTFLFVFTLGTLWCILHFLRGKDLNCEDADHFCSKCNVKLGEYTAF